MKSKVGWISCILPALFFGSAAHAAVIMTLEQAGSNVVATGSGTIDFTDLVIQPPVGPISYIYPLGAAVLEGGAGNQGAYGLGISGPSSFGTGTITNASTGTGDELGIIPQVNEIVVPHGYVSGSPLSSTATFDSTTLAGLGVIPGTYTWTWGSGADADSLTLYAGVPVPAPEPSPAFLLTLAAAAFAVWSAQGVFALAHWCPLCAFLKRRIKK